MTQFDVFDNPVPQARRAFPLVAVLQSDLANTGRERIVAPLAPRAHMPGTAGKLTPIVKVAQIDHVLLVPRMAAIPAHELQIPKGSLTVHRADIVAALDYLFLGL